MDWSIDEAISKFKTLSKDAFQKRKWFKYTILRYIAPLMYPDKYKSEGIERALHKAFGDGPLFGHESYARSSKADRVRVGVVVVNCSFSPTTQGINMVMVRNPPSA
jgi:hypothetical protein